MTRGFGLLHAEIIRAFKVLRGSSRFPRVSGAGCSRRKRFGLRLWEMAKLTQILSVMMLSQMPRRRVFLLIPFVVIVLMISAAYAPGQGNSLGRSISSATFTFQSWRNQDSLSLDKDYRDVIYPNRNLFYGLLPGRSC